MDCFERKVAAWGRTTWTGAEACNFGQGEWFNGTHCVSVAAHGVLLGTPA